MKSFFKTQLLFGLLGTFLLFSFIGQAQTPIPESSADEPSDGDENKIKNRTNESSEPDTSENNADSTSETSGADTAINENETAIVSKTEQEPGSPPSEEPDTTEQGTLKTQPEAMEQAAVMPSFDDLGDVESAMGRPMDKPYSAYLTAVPDKHISFAQFMYNHSEKKKRSGVLSLAIGLPIGVALFGVGLYLHIKGDNDDCLAENYAESDNNALFCSVEDQRDARHIKDGGDVLMATGVAGAILFSIMGIGKIAKGNRRMEQLAPLVHSKNTQNTTLSYIRLIPVAHRNALGLSLSSSF